MYVCLETLEEPTIFFDTVEARDAKLDTLNEKYGVIDYKNAEGFRILNCINLGTDIAYYGITKGEKPTLPEVVVIAESKHIDIDTNEVVSESKTVVVRDSIPEFPDNSKLEQALEMRRQLHDATSEFALTVGIPKLNESDTFYAHIFGGCYDLWVKDYNPTERQFFGFASFGGINDQDAEYGYVSLDELLEQSPKLERDLYWTPCTLESLQNPVVRES